MAFLFATGSILYFKQMTEAEEERGSFMTLLKIGFSTDDIMMGIHRKQLFSFGLPLLIGICHSYFAVKSGWMLFGTELVVPNYNGNLYSFVFNLCTTYDEVLSKNY